ncbi:thrombospondin type 1 domain-containing, putative [Babesia ovis]|uniref:Thrombospondin type 1 domain-containing, putative n=1 Tax=Babesia ovis TaxID=5869 RepID=A0A9W5TA01_BABOV|nr:thrombospondin type 1 domain-containing, putative [Babesia ovis]
MSTETYLDKLALNAKSITDIDNTNEISYIAAYGSGIHLPSKSSLPPEVTEEDYEYAVSKIYNEYNALFNLIQKLRYEKLSKITSQDGWNPFDLQHAEICIPIPIDEVEDYGYDEQTSSCRCPNKMVPCTLQQALDDMDFWTYRLRRLSIQAKFAKSYDTLQLATKHLNIINHKGTTVQSGKSDLSTTERRQQCNAVDAVLCSAKDPSKASTQWSSWGGCSEKCNSGKQERFKIIHNKGARSFIVEERECMLATCSEYNQQGVRQCSLSIVPPSEYGQTVVRTCTCPDKDSVVCSSEEARITMHNWLPQFREFCKKTLNHSANNILHKDLPQLKTQYLGRFIQLRFKDGYYFDCSERWGTLDNDDTTSYCKIGSPILCREQIAKSTVRVSFLESPIKEIETPKVTIFTRPLMICLFMLTLLYTLVRLLLAHKQPTTKQARQ